MTEPAGGLRDRRRPDVMELLARARPASLDPGQAPQRQAAEIASLVATETAAAGTAAAGTAAAGTAGARPTGAGPGPVPPRRARRLPRGAVLTGFGATAAAAVAVAVLVANAGGTGTVPGGRARSPVLLTAAMVHQVASASRSALARSGRAKVSYSSTQNGRPEG